MSILKIARMGHPVLRQRAEPVPDAGLPELQRIIADMAETMIDANGIGLAAPQVYLPLRLFVWRQGEQVAALLNPVLFPLDATVERAWEGCLSIPGLRGEVPRAARIRFTGQDEHGEPVVGEAEGLLARVMQHETDHLDGILYPERMDDMSRFGFGDELAAAAERARAAAAP